MQPSFDSPAADWLVFADALQQKGDARGELLALNEAALRGENIAARDAYVREHAAALFGDVANKVTLEWTMIADRVSLNISPADDPAAVVAALLASPIASLTRELRLVALTPESTDNVDLSGAVALVASKLPTNCTGLALVDDRATRASRLVSTDYEPEDNLVNFGPLTPVFAIAHLESLELHVADPMQLAVGPISAPALRRFGLYGLRWSEAFHDEESALAKTLAAARWPRLESFALRIPETFTCSVPDNFGAYLRSDHYDDPQYADEIDDDDGENEGVIWEQELGGVLKSFAKTGLTRLALHSFDSSHMLLNALEAWPLPPTLKTLDLSESELSDNDAGWILEHRALFANLELLDLSRTRISDRVAATLADLGPRVVHSRGGSEHRFVVGME